MESAGATGRSVTHLVGGEKCLPPFIFATAGYSSLLPPTTTLATPAAVAAHGRRVQAPNGLGEEASSIQRAQVLWPGGRCVRELQAEEGLLRPSIPCLWSVQGQGES